MPRLTLSEQLTQAQATISTQLQALENQQREIIALRQEAVKGVNEVKVAIATAVAGVEKKLSDKEVSYNYQQSRLAQVESELEQAHAVLDGVEGAPSREYERQDGYGGKVNRNVVTRLAGAFLTIAKSGSVK